jgi:hypothetical protein
MRLGLVLAASLLIAGCSSETSKNIPVANGHSGDVFVVMDSLQWRGPLGRSLDSLFTAEMPGLPRAEAAFKFRWLNPRKFNFVLKQSRNIIMVLTLDQNTEGSRIVRKLFTEESIKQIKTNPNQFVQTTEDIFAKGQEIMYLYGNEEKSLLQFIRTNGGRLTEFFDQKERTRLTRSLFKAGQVAGVSDMLKKEFECDLKAPFGYKLADKKPNFVWLRQINPKDDKNIFISRKPYTSADDFRKDNLIRFRDEICSTYLFEDPDQPDSYLLTETKVPFIPVTADTVTFNKHFAIRLRGLWRTNTLGMGGPFEGFALVDESKQQFYYIEGFTFSPGKDQRETMRELETILYTFRTSEEIAAKK